MLSTLVSIQTQRTRDATQALVLRALRETKNGSNKRKHCPPFLMAASLRSLREK